MAWFEVDEEEEDSTGYWKYLPSSRKSTNRKKSETAERRKGILRLKPEGGG